MSMGLDGSCILCGKPMENALLCGCQGGMKMEKTKDELSWNSAIEAAAKEADALKDAIIIFDDKDITPRNLVIQFERAACFRDCAARIRALKKNTNAQA